MVAVTKFVKEPLQATGCLDGYDFFEVTPCIGRQYTNLSLRDLLNSPDSDELLREFAIIVSIRGVVFLRDQEMSLEEQRTLTQKLGVLTGKPKESGLYVHPSVRAKIDHVVHAEAQEDDQVYLVSNRLTLSRKAFFPEDSEDPTWLKRNRDLGKEWHSDTMWEAVPSDYSFLRMLKHPPSGGDTLWASGVEVYNRLSPKMQQYLQSLTFTSDQQEALLSSEKKSGVPLWTDARGHPLNSGKNWIVQHPLIRTNPVTGLSSVYGVGLHVKEINNVTNAESEYLKKMLLDTIMRNHDLQVRFRWLPNSCAIWDNRSVYHAATPDVDDRYERLGLRYLSIGEIPYFDPEADKAFH